MGMYCDEAAGDQLVEGLKGCTAVKRKDGNVIEVWCEEYDLHYGNVPGDFTAEQINVVMSFWRAGEASGRKCGAIEKQYEIRRALGVL